MFRKNVIYKGIGILLVAAILVGYVFVLRPSERVEPENLYKC